MYAQTATASFTPLYAPLDASFAMRRLALPTSVQMAFTFRDGTGLPLLFLTANRTSRRIFDFVLMAMNPANPIAAPDYRGLGESSAPEGSAWTLDEHLDDIIALVDALGWDRFAVIGQATGATLSLLLATRLPQRVVAVAAGDAAISLRADVFTLFLNQVARHDSGFHSRHEALAETPFREEWSDEIADHWLDTALDRSADGLLRWRYHRRAITETQRALTTDLWPRIEVTQPCLLFHGANCTVIGADQMALAQQNIPQARFARLDNANHRLTQDNPEGFAQLVSTFLTQEGIVTIAG